MVSSTKLNPQDHRALESGLNTLHGTRLGPKKFIKWARIEDLKDMNRAGARAVLKPCIKWPLDPSGGHVCFQVGS